MSADKRQERAARPALLTNHHHHSTMTNPYDQRTREPQYTLCPNCGEDLEWHTCDEPSERTLRIRELNDALRATRDHIGVLLGRGQLVITQGVAAHGNDFIDRAVEAVRRFNAFSTENDPYGEHDFGKFTLDGYDLFWKIDYYDKRP
jgi:Protein of unknown function (DUF3768)